MYPGFEGRLNARSDLGFLKKADSGVPVRWNSKICCFVVMVVIGVCSDRDARDVCGLRGRVGRRMHPRCSGGGLTISVSATGVMFLTRRTAAQTMPNERLDCWQDKKF